MKKSTLALSVAAALGGLGFVSNALAIGAISGAPAGSVLRVNDGGIGHQLVIPYFTTQGDNATLINITNTDKINGKVVKVRFRGAANSDDLYDFTLFLSPGDVWTASLSKDVSGASKIATTDKSCVLPSTAGNAVFSLATTTTGGRLDQTLTGDALASQTREGYVEILTMADIAPNTALFGTTKHKVSTATPQVANTAPDCNGTVFETTVGTDVVDVAAAAARGMTPPTGGLTGDWIILNQLNTAAWSGYATALQVQNAAGTASVAGNLVFWPQKFDTPGPSTVNNTATGAIVTATAALSNATADQLLINGVVAAQQYDLPDLSTPYADPTAAANATAAARADASTALLAIRSLKHQYVTDPGIAGVTDVLLSQPFRRYSVGVNYAAGAALYRPGATYYTTGNTALSGRQVCLSTLSVPRVGDLFDREETTPLVGTSSFIISPNTPEQAQVLRICGEASVLAINQVIAAGGSSAALSSSVAVNGIAFSSIYTNGWADWNLNTATGLGLPILGSTFMRARNGTVNYGFAFAHKSAF